MIEIKEIKIVQKIAGNFYFYIFIPKSEIHQRQ